MFFAISAPSGTGKTTIVQRLLKEFPQIDRSVSCTTRVPRAGEVDHVDYHFIDEAKFRQMVDHREFFEWEEVHGALYGTPKAPLLERRRKGQDTILDIDTRGAINLKRDYPDSCLVFLMPPSLEELEKRLRQRQTEAESALKRRLENARREMAEHGPFDFVVVNDDIERAYQEVRGILLQRKKVK
ncbi:MAG: guanylate kinase [Deltaproteobacteria bacterium]|nr:guanylate kinase [Deltaproteobacteria bacterium]